jgi:thiol-disulfide isomerase/thioredoxin
LTRPVASFRALLSTLLLVCLLTPTMALPQDVPLPGRRPMFDFPPQLQWLNVERPLTTDDLEGRVVLLDFWTYGCINCLHVAEQLRRLELRFGDDLVVIGVHTPKFDNEKNLETLRSTVVRLDRRHPIVNDPEWRLARRFGVVAWPTLVLITPDLQVLGKVTGEGNEERLTEAITRLLELYRDELKKDKLPVALEQDRFAAALLAAPGKIAVSTDGLRVAISDTLHHRVILTRPDGMIEATFGGPAPGFEDGPARHVRFNAPQGLAFTRAGLAVADTGNHAIRLITLDEGRVSTLAGTGQIGDLRKGEYDALRLGLRSPWALASQDSWLYIAMAGNHQIWRLNLLDGRISPYAGSRLEGIDEGPLAEASFSQPSGLALTGKDLYVADAEASAIRRIRLTGGTVENLVGKGLFEFGDRDGPLDKALLQHVSDVAVANPQLLVVADTYNHKIKLIDLKNKRVSTLVGTGDPGNKLGEPTQTQLNEPGGLAVLDDLVLVADTNNHRILVVNRLTRSVSEWALTQR